MDLHLAIAAKDRGDLVGALGYFRSALQSDPENALAHAHVAHCLHQMGKHFAAARASETALSLNPSLPLAHVVKALSDTVLDDAKSADAALREALRLDPENKNALELQCAKALAHRDKAALRDAVSALLSLDAEDHGAHYFASRLATLSLDGADAEMHARTALRLKPTAAESHLAIGWAFWAQKKFDHAKEAALSALSLAPNAQDAHQLLTAVEMHRKPVTGWFHRIGYVINNLNVKKAAIYGVPLFLLYETAQDVFRYLGYDDAVTLLSRGVMVSAVLLLISTQSYSKKASENQKAAKLKINY